ncbi:MAG: hypothetical protein KDA99_13715 [Planctomycetales bacterium]|nr:hypothetical protein [Planctomycetales bacterium]
MPYHPHDVPLRLVDVVVPERLLLDAVLTMAFATIVMHARRGVAGNKKNAAVIS